MSDFVKQFLVLKAFWTFDIFTVPQEPMKFSKKKLIWKYMRHKDINLIQ